MFVLAMASFRDILLSKKTKKFAGKRKKKIEMKPGLAKILVGIYYQ